jgi:hypothetical protein
MSQSFCHGAPMQMPRWPLLLLLTACGTDVALPDAAQASRPPSVECEARAKQASSANELDATFTLDNANLGLLYPEAFSSGTQTPSVLGPDDTSLVIRGTTTRQGASLRWAWPKRWTPGELAVPQSRIWKERTMVACDEPTGNQEPGATSVQRVDDADGSLLFLKILSSIHAQGVIPFPAHVPVPAGLSFAWRASSDTSCQQAEVELLIGGDGLTTTVRRGVAAPVSIRGREYVAHIIAGAAPPAEGNFCGQVYAVLFKKGLFVPPAN